MRAFRSDGPFHNLAGLQGPGRTYAEDMPQVTGEIRIAAPLERVFDTAEPVNLYETAVRTIYWVELA